MCCISTGGPNEPNEDLTVAHTYMVPVIGVIVAAPGHLHLGGWEQAYRGLARGSPTRTGARCTCVTAHRMVPDRKN